jgi:DNA primase
MNTIPDLLKEDGLDPRPHGPNEFESPCPFCGGKDRFVTFVDKDRYWCRQCNAHGDAVEYLRKFRHMSFVDAARFLDRPDLLKDRAGSSSDSRRSVPPPPPPPTKKKSVVANPDIWRERVGLGIERANRNLMNSAEVLNWLLSARGITRETAERFKLGWLSENKFFEKEGFGLVPDGKRLLVPAGLTIPWSGRRLRVRRSNRDDAAKYGRYYLIPGSKTDPMLIGEPGEVTAIIVESELDAILLAQELTRPVCIVALGSTNTKPYEELIEALSAFPVVLVALDNDPAGAKAARQWLSAIPASFRGITPGLKDFGDAFLAGIDLNEWLSVAIEIAAEDQIDQN